MARTTVWPTIQRVRRQLHSGFRYESLTLAGNITADATTVAFTTTPPAKLTVGSTLCIGLELMRVESVRPASSTATVVRGAGGSDATTHSAGSEVEISPRWEPLTLYDAMVAEIQSWAPSLFGTVIQITNITDDTEVVELETELLGNYGLLAALYTPSGSSVQRRVRFREAGASTPIVRLIDPLTAGTIEIVAATAFDVSTLALTDDLVADIGLRPSMVDLLELGIKVRLTPDGEHQRTGRLVQDMTRRAEEVPLGAYVNHANHQLTLYRIRKEEEVKKLRALYPVAC